MVNLFTTYYNEKDPVRSKELLDCIRLNDSCSAIDKIYVWLENMDVFPYKSEKIIIIHNSSRPSFNDLFEEINKVSKNDDVNIISNTDIFFKDDFTIIRRLDLKEKCFALTRWDMQEDGSAEFYARVDSQDTWIFKGKIQNIAGDFKLGALGCDNKIAYEIQKAGYQLLNPSITVKSYHLHLSQHRVGLSAYTAKPLSGPYLYIPISTHEKSFKNKMNIFSSNDMINKKNNFFLMHRLYSSWIHDMILNKEKNSRKLISLLIKCFYYRPSTNKKYLKYFFKKLVKPSIKLWLS